MADRDPLTTRARTPETLKETKIVLMLQPVRNIMTQARTPDALKDIDRPLEECIAACFPRSHALLEGARLGLFYSLPVAFDPAQGTGCYLATIDRDDRNEPWRFLDMGALIATRAYGENDPRLTAAILADLPAVVNRYAHSEYQTVLSLRFKAALDRLAPKGTPRHFVVNTGAEAVENAIKAALLVRARTAGQTEGGAIISFEGAFHGRTLGALAVTHRKKARLGFPTFNWPQAIFPVEDLSAPVATQRREERSLRQVWETMHGHGERGLFLEGLQQRYPEIILNVRGQGVMRAFDVVRSDWRDVPRDRAFRRGLILLPAGERALRFYPRYDTPEATIQEAVSILVSAMEEILARGAAVPLGPLLRWGPITVPAAGARVFNRRNAGKA
jgi:4-aminobutyrate aminotransferase-like enzyme